MGSSQWRGSQTGLRQTHQQPISTKKFVALCVHTNQQYIKYSETKYMEKSSIGNNFKNIEKHTRTALVAIALFLLLLCFSVKNPQNPLFPTSSLTYIYYPCFLYPQIFGALVWTYTGQRSESTKNNVGGIAVGAFSIMLEQQLFPELEKLTTRLLENHLRQGTCKICREEDLVSL